MRTTGAEVIREDAAYHGVRVKNVYALCRSHRIEGRMLAQSLAEVARGRGVEMRALSVVTVGYAELAQDRWTAWLRKQGLAERVPPTFAELLAAVHAFADDPLTSRVAASEWDPDAQHWR
ncbi:MAG TPA: hypothetical protein VI299_18285 [Polyangiales bacterium]